MSLGIFPVPPILCFAHAHHADGIEEDRERDQRYGKRDIARSHRALSQASATVAVAISTHRPVWADAELFTGKAFLKVDGAARKIN